MTISNLSTLNNNTYNKYVQNKDEEFKNKLENVMNKDEIEMKKACTEFEAYFVQQMFKEMRKTVNDQAGIIKVSQAELTFRDMLDEENSKKIANSGGIGLADMMYKQMKVAQTYGGVM